MSMEREARECEWISETAGVRSTERSSHVQLKIAGGDALMGNTRSHSEHDG